MISQKQMKIIDALKHNLNRGISFNEIKEFGKLKSHNFIQSSLNKLSDENLIKIEKRGNIRFYSLKIFPKMVHYLALLGFEMYKVKEDVIDEVIKEVSNDTVFFSLIVFGSYSANQQSKNSDVDICIIVKDNKEVAGVEARMKSAERKINNKIHYFVFGEKEFRKMLESEQENVGKEIARNHLVYYNPEAFYKIIEKWNRR